MNFFIDPQKIVSFESDKKKKKAYLQMANRSTQKISHFFLNQCSLPTPSLPQKIVLVLAYVSGKIQSTPRVFGITEIQYLPESTGIQY